MIEPNNEFNEKIIKHIIMKYKLGDITASCIYFDVLTAYQNYSKKESNGLKASIPDGVKKWLDLKSGQILEWKMETVDDMKRIVIVSVKSTTVQNKGNVK